MPSFIEQINWVNLAKVPSPTNGIRRGDRKIGVMSEDLRRIYGMCLQVKSEEYSLAKKMSDIGDGVLKKKKSDFSLDKAQKHGESILSVTIELGNQVTLREVWTTLFFNAVKVEFPELVDKENIEVRRGFTIVLNEREEARNHAEALFGAIREVFKPYNIPKRKIKLKKGKFKKK